jgi:hypothetical protein
MSTIRPLIFASLLACLSTAFADDWELKPDAAGFAKFKAKKAPSPTGLLLRKNDRLAIIGDSITEQKMYSRIIETYLTTCLPHLKIGVRQYGWGGETAEGFKNRMTNDVLRFKPTIATTSYGMNDHRYTTYDEKNGQWYRDNQQAIVQAFKAVGARVVLGSPGCVGPKVPWSKSDSETMNLNLCELRNIALALAQQEQVTFADVFWPMLTLGWTATNQFGETFTIAGKDSVHPGWAGHVVMASAYLKALGVDGEIGTFTVELGTGRASATAGHEVISYTNGEVTLKSSRYPFCTPSGALSDDNTIRSGMALVDFPSQFNRLYLVVKENTAKSCEVTWGKETKTYTAQQLATGINLTAEFLRTPFDESFRRVDEAVGRKQNYETKQVKSLFHGEEGNVDMDATIALTEKARALLVDAIRQAAVPVIHHLKIKALN